MFCAESSLRYIYESQQEPPVPGTPAAALSSLASSPEGFAKSLSYDTLTQEYPDKNIPPSTTSKKILPPAQIDGVDLLEAEIAKSCVQIAKQAATLPHSFRECSVCLSQNAHAQIGLCGHTFHSKCFLRWFRANRSCPLCRGPVDRIQCAPVVLSVQDELEAIMAEMDDVDGEVVDPLMENPDLISFLGADFDDADMEMMPLDDVSLALDKHHSHSHPHPHHHSMHLVQEDDVSMDDEESDSEEPFENDLHGTISQQPPTGPFGMQLQMPMQFAPTTTMPNYWNVLNQGLSMPSGMPPAPPSSSSSSSSIQQQQHRMVHIAPKPDGHFPVHSPSTHPNHAHSQASMYGHHQQHSHPFASSSSSTSTASPPAVAVSSIQPVPTVSSPATPRVVSCRCTGGCRNGRCACVKEGAMCGISCRCTSCKNPFLMVKAAGADIDALLQDACFMHNVSKTRDMVVRMQEAVDVPCCGRSIKVIDCVQGYKCTLCDRQFDFSWCMNRLLDHDKTPRNHCDVCKRCCDHRDVHCNDCGRCYFAGVAASLPCPCKESSRKRRDQMHASSSSSPVKDEPASGDDGDDDGECTIM